MERFLVIRADEQISIKRFEEFLIKAIKGCAATGDLHTILKSSGKTSYPVIAQVHKLESGQLEIWINPRYDIGLSEGTIHKIKIEMVVADAFEKSGLATRARNDKELSEELQKCLIQIANSL